MNRPSILIVEDETIIAMELESSLQQMGYSIASVVNTGESAISAVENRRPDIVLMDIQLAGKKNGIETAEIIQARFRLPVIFLTAHPDKIIQDTVEKSSQQAYSSFLSKPYRENDLKTAIEMALRVSEADAKRLKAEGALRKRLKELNCLYGIAALVEKPNSRIQDILQGTIKLLQDAVQFPNMTEARLSLEEVVYETGPFRDIHQKISTDVRVEGNWFGSLEIGFTGTLPNSAEEWFPVEERDLLEAVAERIGRTVERIRIREELSGLNTKYQELFERMSSGVAFYQAVDDGADFIFTAFNRAAELIENMNRNDVIGKRVTSVFPGIREMGLLDLFQRVWKTGNPEMLPVKQYSDNRILGWRENHVIKLPSGEIVAIYDDRTVEMQAREQIEEALKEKELSEAKYRDLYHHSPDMYFTIDLSGWTITECNQTFIRQIGYPVNQIIGSPFERFLTGESATFFKTRIVAQLSETGEFENADLQLVCADGSVPDTQLKITTLPDSQGLPRQAFGVLRDETAKKQLERERSDFEKQLMHLQKMEAIATLAGGIAHDFNNILHPIMGYTRMAKKRVHLDPKTFGYLEQISTSANRARQLINQLLSFSRPDRQEFSVIDLKPVLKETLHFIKATIPASIEIERKIDDESGNIMGNPSQIHQILMNLITNAYQAMEDYGGRLSVEMFPLDPTMEEWFLEDPGVKRGVALLISDTGPGIDENIIDRIFDPYFTTKESGKGTGLGLATVQGIVKAHGGDIRVTSCKGYGTTFHLIFPEAEEDAEANPEESQQKIPTGIEHVLLVDDEYRIVALEKEMLEELGYTITSRTGSIDALEAFRANPERYDLVLTDMNMPNMDGADLAVNLRNLRPDIPIIICTGYSSKIDPERAEAIGVRQLLQKPISFEDLAVAVRKALDNE